MNFNDSQTAPLSARAIYAGFAVATVLAGLALRLIPAGLPAPVVKWGGSVLWAWMVYSLLAALLPRVSALRLAQMAAIVAALVELSRLLHSSGMDAFRLSLAGKLLLGRVFSAWHFAVYGTAIGVVVVLDNWIVRSKTSGRADAPGLL